MGNRYHISCLNPAALVSRSILPNLFYEESSFPGSFLCSARGTFPETVEVVHQHVLGNIHPVSAGGLVDIVISVVGRPGDDAVEPGPVPVGSGRPSFGLI